MEMNCIIVSIIFVNMLTFEDEAFTFYELKRIGILTTRYASYLQDSGRDECCLIQYEKIDQTGSTKRLTVSS